THAPPPPWPGATLQPEAVQHHGLGCVPVRTPFALLSAERLIDMRSTELTGLPSARSSFPFTRRGLGRRGCVVRGGGSSTTTAGCRAFRNRTGDGLSVGPQPDAARTER